MSRMQDALRAPPMLFACECRDANGVLRWAEAVPNLVTREGCTGLIDAWLNGSGYTAAWYLLLTSSGTPADTDTLASHTGWTELAPYSGNRPAITWGTTVGGSNTAATITFAITATAIVGGAGCCTVASGTGGLLYNVAQFSVPRAVVSGETLSVTPTLLAN